MQCRMWWNNGLSIDYICMHRSHATRRHGGTKQTPPLSPTHAVVVVYSSGRPTMLAVYCLLSASMRSDCEAFACFAPSHAGLFCTCWAGLLRSCCTTCPLLFTKGPCAGSGFASPCLSPRISPHLAHEVRHTLAPGAPGTPRRRGRQETWSRRRSAYSAEEEADHSCFSASASTAARVFW